MIGTLTKAIQPLVTAKWFWSAAIRHITVKLSKLQSLPYDFLLSALPLHQRINNFGQPIYTRFEDLNTNTSRTVSAEWGLPYCGWQYHKRPGKPWARCIVNFHQ